MSYHYVESGLDNVHLKNGYHIVDDLEYGELTTLVNAKGLHEAIGCELAQSNAALTGAEFRFLRVELKLSQKDLGSLLDVDPQTIARWEKGQNPIQRASEIVLRDYYQQTVFGKGNVKKLIEILSQLDAHIRMVKLMVEEHHEHWKVTTRAA